MARTRGFCVTTDSFRELFDLQQPNQLLDAGSVAQSEDVALVLPRRVDVYEDENSF
jgi:hypothetical protein